jgi:hypothetical protein
MRDDDRMARLNKLVKTIGDARAQARRCGRSLR